jgi:hypothetical protein
MEQTSSWEASSQSASQEIYLPIMELEVSLPCSQEPQLHPAWASSNQSTWFLIVINESDLLRCWHSQF